MKTLNSINASIAAAEQKVSDLRREVRDAESMLTKLTWEKRALEDTLKGRALMADMQLSGPTIKLIEQVDARRNQVKHLQDGNRWVQGANWKLNRMLNGELPVSFKGEDSPLAVEARVLQTLVVIMQEDSAAKTMELRERLHDQFSKINEALRAQHEEANA